MPKEEKSADIEVQRRTQLCLERLLQGWIPYRIFQYVSRMEQMREAGNTDRESGYNEAWDWGVSGRMIYYYCDKANEELEKIQAGKRQINYNLSLARWNDLLRKAILKDDLGNARLIQKEIDKITGVHDFGAGSEKPEPTKFKLGDGTIIEI